VPKQIMVEVLQIGAGVFWGRGLGDSDYKIVDRSLRSDSFSSTAIHINNV